MSNYNVIFHISKFHDGVGELFLMVFDKDINMSIAEVTAPVTTMDLKFMRDEINAELGEDEEDEEDKKDLDDYALIEFTKAMKSLRRFCDSRVE